MERSDKMKMDVLVCFFVTGLECPDPVMEKDLYEKSLVLARELSHNQLDLCIKRAEKIINGDKKGRAKMEETFIKLKHIE